MSTATASLGDFAAIWREARRVYPIYSALNQQFDLGVASCRDLDSPIDRHTPEASHRIHDWLDKMDSLIEVHQIRQLFQATNIADEEGLRGLLKRQLAKADRNTIVRDKVDYLLVQYYAHCAPHDAHTFHDYEHFAEILHPIVGYAAPDVPESCKELDRILAELDQCSCLGDLLAKNLIDRARVMKEKAGKDYFHPSALVAYARFNFLLRRGYFRLMHADLHAIRFAIHAMESRGQLSCDCSSAKLSADLSFVELREICHTWKKPFSQAYSVGNKFAEVVAIRAALEAALKKPLTPPPPPAPVVSTPQKAVTPPQAVTPEPQPTAVPAAVQGSLVDVCAREIGEALTSVQSKSNAVSNFNLRGCALILASWEVQAYLRPASFAAPVLKRAVAARALIMIAQEARKRGETVDMPSLASLAQVEVAQLQAQIAIAKEQRDVDSAVNLSATAKRLIALVEREGKAK